MAMAMAITSLVSSSLSLRPYRCPSAPLQPSSSCFRRASVAYPSMHLRKMTALKISVRAVADEETLAPEAEPTPTVEQTASAEQTVTVPVSPSDLLTMFFKAQSRASLPNYYIYAISSFGFYDYLFLLLVL